MKIFILSLFVTFSCFSVQAAPLINIQVGEARTKAAKIAFPNIKVRSGTNDRSGQLRAVHGVIVEDLAFSGLFTFISPKAFIEKESAGISKGSFKFSDWTTIGAQFLMKADGSVRNGQISIQIFLYAAFSGKLLLGKKYSANTRTIRKLGHTVANDIMKTLTGRPGPFTSKIVFVSDKSGKKEIYTMDYDGHNIRKVSPARTSSLTLSPNWSPDGRYITYTSLARNSKGLRNHNFYRYDTKTGQEILLSNKNGMNSGGSYSPNGREIALTMSFNGNPEIYYLNPISKKATRGTKSVGLDVDPDWSPDGRYLTFVSDRSGRPMIYRMRRDGSEVKRLTIAGRYNATPSWSPTDNKITFAGWIDGRFDIFIMNPDGTNIERLTKNMGNNEDPHFASDGYFIVYSSNRKGKKNLYLTNIDNTIHRRITNDFGNCYNAKFTRN